MAGAVGGILVGGGAPPAAPRQDLALVESEPDAEGTAAWILHDPLTDRYFRLGWLEVALLGHLRPGASAEGVARAVSDHTARPVTETEVRDFSDWLRRNNLSLVDDAQAEWFERQLDARPGRLATLGKSYLFMRFPLVRPDRFLARTLPVARLLGGRVAVMALVLCGLAGLFLTLREPEAFFGTFMHFFSLEGLAWYAAALALVKIAHELGHGYAAKALGCRVPRMGVALLVLWPVLYTDTSDAWRATGRRGRLAIDAAGILVELGIAAVCLLAWHIVPDGPVRSALFVLAAVSWIMTLAVNLNPFMRFDGYYLLADWLEVENLQERSFALARWWLRERLFGYGAPAPERVRPMLIVYALCVWVYRFFLFLGIALLVYHFFVKVVGIILFLVEIAYFIVAPILREVRVWIAGRNKARPQSVIRTAFVLAVLAALVAVPWRSTLSLPALLDLRHATLYATVPGMVRDLDAWPGQVVAAGTVLVRIGADDLDHRIAQTMREIEALRWQRRVQGLDRGLLSQGEVTASGLQAKLATLEQLRRRRETLALTAPFDGVVAELDPEIAAGDWVSEGRELVTLVDPSRPRLTALVTEENLARLAPGAQGYFLPDGGAWPRLRVRVTEIEAAGLRSLDQPYLASTFGGAVATRPDADDRLIPVNAVYLVRLDVLDMKDAPPRPVTGVVALEATARSLLGQVSRRIRSVLLRETEF